MLGNIGKHRLPMWEQPPYMGTDTGQHRLRSVTDVWEQPDIGSDTGQHRHTSVTGVEAILKGRATNIGTDIGTNLTDISN